MADEQSEQPSNKAPKPVKPEKIDDTNTLGERIETTSDPGPEQNNSPEEYGELSYHDHDEFGEWLDRDN